MKTNQDNEANSPSESAIRQKATRRLWRLTKFRDQSRWANQYGPFALVNERNLMEHYGLSMQDANEILDRMQPAKRGADYF